MQTFDETLNPSPAPDRVPAGRRSGAILAAVAVTMLTWPMGIIGAMGQDGCHGQQTLGCSGVGGFLLFSPFPLAPVVFIGLMIVAALGSRLRPRTWWRAYWGVFGVQLAAVLAMIVAAATFV